MATMTLTTALRQFISCKTPEQCWTHYMTVVPCHEGQETLLMRGCVMAMYRTSNLSIPVLKKLLYDPPPATLNPAGFGMKEAMDRWVEHVGPKDESLHFVKPGAFTDFEHMMGLDLEGQRTLFQYHDSPISLLGHRTQGVMDTLFAASCFQLPSVLAMGSHFWLLARALVLFEVSNSDQLNSILWGLVLPQTVVAMDAEEFYMDSLLDPVHVPIKLKGCVGHLRMTTLYVQNDSNMIFFDDVCFENVCFLHTPPHPDRCVSRLRKFVVELRGVCSFQTNVPTAVAVLKRVEFSYGGLRVYRYGDVLCEDVHFHDAKCGLSLHDVGCVSLESRFLGPGTDPFSGFDYCDLALSAEKVGSLDLEDQSFNGVLQIFDVEIFSEFEMVTCYISNANTYIGKITMPEGCEPVFHGITVSSFINVPPRFPLSLFVRRRGQTPDGELDIASLMTRGSGGVSVETA